MNKNIQDSTKNASAPAYSAAEGGQRIQLPLPPQAGNDTRFEMEVYARFMRHLRAVPNSRMEIKIFSAIQFTADLMDVSDALVAKTLVDCGLKAPRKAFPVSFLDFVDKSMMRTSWDAGSPPVSVMKLRDFWDRIGEDRFAHTMPSRYAVQNQMGYISV